MCICTGNIINLEIAISISSVWFLRMYIKRVPGYKETDPDVQFTNNRVSVPVLMYICIIIYLLNYKAL